MLLGERLALVTVDHVAIDSVSAARTATSHLIGLGRRVIAVIGTGEDISKTGRLRLHGYEEALADAGLPQDASLHGDARWFHRPDGYAAMAKLLPTVRTSTASSVSTTCWRSARCGRCGKPGDTCPTTLRWSASTTSRTACTPRRR